MIIRQGLGYTIIILSKDEAIYGTILWGKSWYQLYVGLSCILSRTNSFSHVIPCVILWLH